MTVSLKLLVGKELKRWLESLQRTDLKPLCSRVIACPAIYWASTSMGVFNF